MTNEELCLGQRVSYLATTSINILAKPPNGDMKQLTATRDGFWSTVKCVLNL